MNLKQVHVSRLFHEKTLLNNGAHPSKYYEKVHIQIFLTDYNLYT